MSFPASLVLPFFVQHHASLRPRVGAVFTGEPIDKLLMLKCTIRVDIYVLEEL